MADKKENQQITCDIIQDLLPLYHDGIVSEKTEEVIKGHLEECAVCSQEYDMLCADLPIKTTEPSTKKQFMNMVRRQKRKQVMIALLSSLMIMILLSGAAYWCIILGFQTSSENIQLTTEFQYDEGSYLDQSFVLHVQRMDGLPLNISVKEIYEENEYGKKVLTGYEVIPKKVFLNIGQHPGTYTIGYSYSEDVAPTDDFDFTITVKFTDKTVVYSMVEEGLFVPQDNVVQYFK